MKSKVIDYILKPIDYDELKDLLNQFAENRKRINSQDKLNQILKQVRPKTAPEEHTSEQVSSEDRIAHVKRFIDEHLRDKTVCRRSG